MILTKEFPGITETLTPQNPNHDMVYTLNDDLEADDVLDIRLFGPLVVNGKISCKGEIFALDDIAAKGDIIAGSNVHTGALMALNGSVYVKGNIYASEEVLAELDINVSGNIVARGFIRAYNGHIAAGGSINAGGNITAKTFIKCQRRIFAGIDPDETTESCNNVIRCAELRQGQLSYGILILNPEAPKE